MFSDYFGQEQKVICKFDSPGITSYMFFSSLKKKMISKAPFLDKDKDKHSILITKWAVCPVTIRLPTAAHISIQYALEPNILVNYPLA